MAIRVAILTISDTCSEGKRTDLSGQAIEDMLPATVFEVCEKIIIPDEYRTIASTLRDFSDRKAIDVVLTTGGTGLGPRDVTPEATTAVCDRMVPGLSEILRSESFKKTPNAVLSRGISAMRENTLIINLPGSPKAVRECLEVILNILPHAVEMMRGGGHCD
ncbi:MAG: molybdenum cofactor biosynthesis protein [Planctomycetes bacterium RBG_16_55_9]|nr:MAG: molybdenum cofactor biosynthesis protein [Planctomycetes bacterium RBG_16_55_9]